MQGPITVFDDGAYAGDAQIQDLPPGTERLISYAMDLDTEVAPTSTRRAGAACERARSLKGTLQITATSTAGRRRTSSRTRARRPRRC